ncbi:hypothetical protein FVEN_g12687 [Fusarium venenatum]|nr:hypothetical protein FVEN_g12687 [Fusarium venenatum]
MAQRRLLGGLGDVEALEDAVDRGHVIGTARTVGRRG